jgi:hypothetical protein
MKIDLAAVRESPDCPVPITDPIRDSGAQAAEMFYRNSPDSQAGFSHGISWTLGQLWCSRELTGDIIDRAAENGRVRRPITIEHIRAEAQRQLIKEKFEAAVATEKVKLRTGRPWWQIIFPFKITIERRK